MQENCLFELPACIDGRQVSTVSFQEILKKDFNEQVLQSFILIMPLQQKKCILCIYLHTDP